MTLDTGDCPGMKIVTRGKNKCLCENEGEYAKINKKL
jgi:hypothetical protein